MLMERMDAVRTRVKWRKEFILVLKVLKNQETQRRDEHRLRKGTNDLTKTRIQLGAGTQVRLNTQGNNQNKRHLEPVKG